MWSFKGFVLEYGELKVVEVRKIAGASLLILEYMGTAGFKLADSEM